MGTDAGQPGPSCIAFCDKAVVECNAFPTLDEESCRQTCALDRTMADEISEECGEAFDGELQCAAELTCEELEDWLQPDPEDSFPCRDATQERVDACGAEA